MKNQDQKKSIFSDIGLWVWIVTAASALLLAALTVFFFAPASRREKPVKPQNSVYQQTSRENEGIRSAAEEPAVPTEAQTKQRITIAPEAGGYVLTLENKKSASWEKVFSCPAKVSENGVSTAYGEGKGKTPEGTFRILFCIGISTPGTGLDYIELNEKYVWVDDQYSQYYNTLQREGAAGADWRSAENIYSYFSSGDANYAIFFDYNGDGKTAHSASGGKGSVLFLFGRNDYDTAVSRYGDIYISASDMKSLLTYLFSYNDPVITISAPKVSDDSGGAVTKEVMYSYVDELMVRTGPGTEYAAIDKLYIGSPVDVIDEGAEWAHINYNGQDAWVSNQYLTKLKPDYIMAVRHNYEPARTAIESGLSISPQYRGEDNAYVYCQVYWGGGWQCVKVRKELPYTVEEMSEAERAQYEINPYANTGK